MKSFYSILVLLFVTIVIAAVYYFPFFSPQTNQIICTANEGIIIDYDNHIIAIDAFFEKEFYYLDAPSDSINHEIKKGNSRFNELDVLLTTHLHGDHFNKNILIGYLEKNKASKLICTNETYDKTLTEISNQLKEQLLVTNKEKLSEVLLKEGSLKITAYSMKHLDTPPWSEAENSTCLIEIGEFKILHFVDAAIIKENLEEHNF